MTPTHAGSRRPVVPAATGPTVADVVGLLETLYPLDRAESWDRVGLVLGEGPAPVRRVLLAVDPTVAVAREAEASDLLITHHPLLLRGASQLPADTGKGAVVTTLIRGGTALWSGHTNVDRSADGTATALADALGLLDRTPLVPPDRIEDGLLGLGVVGRTARATTVGTLASRLAGLLPATVQGARYTGDPRRTVRRVAVCPGAGDSELATATAARADVYVTSDLRHHPALEHLESAADPAVVPALIDIPHFAAESLWLPVLQRVLRAAAEERDWDLTVAVSGLSTDPWTGAARP
ncbi:Nif3-like dinuclear metal center hexameric protein [Brachybacterium sp. AOP25-B2-12]|uniref:Nif3-like dinuclear metal center hexameric protein n=1 Tax=Brachybacterium sp. AOP25-B2-12 TaxID=3457710 RepID=UPI004033BB40